MRGEWLTLVETPSRLQSRLLDTLAFSFTWEAPLDPHFLSELTFYCLLFGVGVALHSPFERLLFAEQTLTTLRPCSRPVTASLPTLSPPQTHTHREPPPPPHVPQPWTLIGEAAQARGRVFLWESLWKQPGANWQDIWRGNRAFGEPLSPSF